MQLAGFLPRDRAHSDLIALLALSLNPATSFPSCLLPVLDPAACLEAFSAGVGSILLC